MAAIQVRRDGDSVALICRDQYVGGMATNGLGFTDTGDASAIGGLSRQFYRDVKADYAARGVRPTPAQAKSLGEDGDAMWAFEPHVAEKILETSLRKAGVTPIRSAPLRRDGRGVAKRGARILSLETLDGRVFSGRTFIDATYEGDLMAEAGVRFTVGREADRQTGEALNGVQSARATQHQFDRDVDPYVTPGEPASGLLPHVEVGPAGRDGAADRRVQAYCFRLCMTTDPRNRAPITRPANYDPGQYELLRRYLAAGGRNVFPRFAPIPNGKADANSHGPFSLDDVGMNDSYPTGTDAERARIVREHRDYQQGLLWFLQNDPRSPADVRAKMAPWGLCRDEFTQNANWPRELYVREARRMVSDFVITERHLRGRLPSPHSIGVGSYVMDSHNVRRYVDARGFARNEGDVQVPLRRSYVISYDAIVPRKREADNLLVPVALSASHIAYGSIRMEPVFMILGQSAGTAAVIAAKRDVAVQDVPYAELRPALLREGQVLTLQKGSFGSIRNGLIGGWALGLCCAVFAAAPRLLRLARGRSRP